jgi:hypothetical protein
MGGEPGCGGTEGEGEGGCKRRRVGVRVRTEKERKIQFPQAQTPKRAVPLFEVEIVSFGVIRIAEGVGRGSFFQSRSTYTPSGGRGGGMGVFS